MTADKDIAAQLRAQADQEDAAAQAEAARATADRALADQLDPAIADPPVAGPPAGGPTLFPFDPGTGIRVGGDGDTFVPLIDGAMFYGADISFVAKRVPGGVPILIGAAYFGGDPNPDATKSAYVADPLMIKAPPTTLPAPPPVDLPAPSPVDTGVPPAASPPPVAAPPVASPPPAAPGPAAPAPAEAPGTPAALEAMTPAQFQTELGLHFGLAPDEIPEAVLAAMPASYPGGSTGALSLNQTQTGEQSDIGLIPDFGAVYAITKDKRALANLKANVHCLPALPYHLRTADGQLAKPWEHPNASSGDFGPDATASPDARTDIQHQDHAGYAYAVAMRIAGDDVERQFALNEMKARVALNFFASTPAARGNGDGVINPQDSYVSGRGAGWAIAAQFQLLKELPAGDEWRPWLQTAVEHTGAFLRDYYIANPASWGHNQIGMFGAGGLNADGNPAAGEVTHYRAFMQAFMCQGVLFGEALKLPMSDDGKSAWKIVADFACTWLKTITAPRWYRYMGMYDVYVGTVRADGGADLAKNGDELFELNIVPLGHPDLGADDYVLRQDFGTAPIESIGGGYVANVQFALAMGADRDADCMEAWARLEWSEQYKRSDVHVQFAGTPKGRMIRDAVTNPLPKPPLDPIPVIDPDPTPIVTEPADQGAGYLPTTVGIEDTDDLSASANGSTFTMKRPESAEHTLAYPPGGCIKIDPARAEVATPSGTGWRELPNTRLDSVMTAPVGGGYLSAALQNWTGWGWSEQLRLAAGYQGGGHNGNNNANWIGFDEKTLRPLEFFAPLPLTGIALGGSAGDKAPGPEFMQNVHWYGTQQGIIDARDGKPKFMHVGTSVDGSASIFDPMAGTIEKMAPYLLHGAVTTSDTDLGEDTTGFTAVFEPESKIYLAHSKGRANQLSHFEPGRNRWFGHGDETCWGGYWGNGNGQTSGFPGYNVIRLDPKRRRVVSMSRENGIGTLDLAWLKDLRGQSRPFCDFAYSTPRVDGVQPPETAMLSTIATFDYDDDFDDFLIYDIDPDNAAQGIVYSMHPETFAITVLERGGPPPNANGTWGRWWKSKARGEWFTVAGIDQNFWSFRRAR